MIFEITVPQAGESVTEAEIAFWHKENGDIVELDEPIVELETEKASQELFAESAGKLTILADSGEVVKVGQVIGSIDSDAAPAAAEEAESNEVADAGPVEEPIVPESVKDAVPAEAKPKPEKESEALSTDSANEESAGLKKIPSPAARRLMVLNGVSAQDVHGAGRDGRITKADVLRYLKLREKQLKIPSTASLKEPELKEIETSDQDNVPDIGRTKPAKPDEELPPGVRKERMSMMRRTIARRLVEVQQTAAILTTFNEVDMHNVIELRKAHKENFKKKYDANLGFLSFFAKAVVVGLREYPVINAQIQGDDIVYHDFVNLGIAVSTPKGLMAPVIRNVQDLSFGEIEQQISALATKGREGSISLDDMSAGTFTITNGGVFGSMLSTPILNRPQSGILGMHNIVERPWVVDGEIKVRPIMYVALSYDHRLIDGAQAVKFLVTVKSCIEDPSRIMLEL